MDSNKDGRNFNWMVTMMTFVWWHCDWFFPWFCFDFLHFFFKIFTVNMYNCYNWDNVLFKIIHLGWGGNERDRVCIHFIVGHGLKRRLTAARLTPMLRDFNQIRLLLLFSHGFYPGCTWQPFQLPIQLSLTWKKAEIKIPSWLNPSSSKISEGRVTCQSSCSWRF